MLLFKLLLKLTIRLQVLDLETMTFFLVIHSIIQKFQIYNYFPHLMTAVLASTRTLREI